MKIRSLILSAALLLSFGARAVEVTVSPDNINRIADYDGGRDYHGLNEDFTTWWGGADRYWHSFVQTDVATFNSALEAGLGTLGDGES